MPPKSLSNVKTQMDTRAKKRTAEIKDYFDSQSLAASKSVSQQSIVEDEDSYIDAGQQIRDEQTTHDTDKDIPISATDQRNIANLLSLQDENNATPTAPSQDELFTEFSIRIPDKDKIHESGKPFIPTHSVSLNQIDATPMTNQRKLITDMIMGKTNPIATQKKFDLNEKVAIHEIKSHDLLNLSNTPFFDEESLPNFDHGSPGLYYFQLLRNLLSKIIRAQLQNNFLLESQERKQIPRGFKINKRILAVEPSPRLKLAHFKAMAAAETAMLEATIEHYSVVIPRLKDEFNEYFEELNSLPAIQRRLVILKLSHYKNELLIERTQSFQNKIERDNNIVANGTANNDISAQRRTATPNSPRAGPSNEPPQGYYVASPNERPQGLPPRPQRFPRERWGRGKK